MTDREPFAEVFVRFLRPIVIELVDERIEELREGRSEKQWLTLTEAAQQLGCTADAVRMRARRGRINRRYQGRRLYVSGEDVRELRRATDGYPEGDK
jgi:hypothetical protein